MYLCLLHSECSKHRSAASGVAVVWHLVSSLLDEGLGESARMPIWIYEHMGIRIYVFENGCVCDLELSHRRSIL